MLNGGGGDAGTSVTAKSEDRSYLEMCGIKGREVLRYRDEEG